MSTNTVYPADHLDDPQPAALLGSLWAGIYGGRDLINSILRSVASVTARSHELFDTLLASCSRVDLPPYRYSAFMPLIWESDEASETRSALYAYDGTEIYGNRISYGQRSLSAYETLAAPTGLVRSAVLADGLSSGWTAVEYVDFSVVDGEIQLVGTFPRTTDDRIVLIGAGNHVDANDVYLNYGYVFDQAGSGEDAKTAVNALYDGTAGGVPVSAFEAVISAASGMPQVSIDSTVRAVFRDGDRLFILTDDEALSYPTTCTETVAAGSTVAVGDWPVSDVSSDPIRNEQAFPDREGLYVPARVLGGRGGLWFPNTDHPVALEEDGNVRFPLGGDPDVIEAFWDRAEAGDTTLADVLDTRDTPEGPPTIVAMPPTINPMEFALGNFVRNGVLVRVNVQACDSGLRLLGRLRDVAPPVCVLVDMEASYSETLDATHEDEGGGVVASLVEETEELDTPVDFGLSADAPPGCVTA